MTCILTILTRHVAYHVARLYIRTFATLFNRLFLRYIVVREQLALLKITEEKMVQICIVREAQEDRNSLSLSFSLYGLSDRGRPSSTNFIRDG